MGCRRVDAKPFSEPMLEYCSFDPQEEIRWNIEWNSSTFIHENAIENIICQMADILSRPQ